MFETLKEWCKHDIVVTRPGALTGSGERSAGTTFTVKGYVVDDVKLIVDKNGKQLTSFSYLYTIPTTLIQPGDLVTPPGYTDPIEIKKLGGYFDGNTGALDIQVVYL